MTPSFKMTIKLNKHIKYLDFIKLLEISAFSSAPVADRTVAQLATHTVDFAVIIGIAIAAKSD